MPRLPAMPRTRPAGPPPVPAPATLAITPATRRAKTVLLVEDSRFAAESVRLVCRRAGLRLRRAETLAAALMHLKVYRPDIALVDLGLPDGSGLDLIEGLARQRPRVGRIVALSGDPLLRAAALRAGADVFLDKPIDLREDACLLLGAAPGGEAPPPDAAQAVGPGATGPGPAFAGIDTLGDHAGATGGSGGATDDSSRAAGGGSRATGGGSRATGDGSRATGGGSRATGDGSRATGDGSRATGDGSRATGDGSRATGDGSRATGCDGGAAGGGAGETPRPDPLALRDDLRRARALLRAGSDPAHIGYAAQFLAGIARCADDGALLASAERARLSGEAAPLIALLGERVAAQPLV